MKTTTFVILFQLIFSYDFFFVILQLIFPFLFLDRNCVFEWKLLSENCLARVKIKW